LEFERVPVQALHAFRCTFTTQSREGGDMPAGTVKWFGDDDAYGDRSPGGGSKDLFVQHRTEGAASSPTRRI